MNTDKVEWVVEPFRGWAIQYAICTTPDGARYTPLNQDFYLTHHSN